MYDHVGHKWGHRNSTKKIKRNLDAISGKHSTESLRSAVTLRRTRYGKRYCLKLEA